MRLPKRNFQKREKKEKILRGSRADDKQLVGESHRQAKAEAAPAERQPAKKKNEEKKAVTVGRVLRCRLPSSALSHVGSANQRICWFDLSHRLFSPHFRFFFLHSGFL